MNFIKRLITLRFYLTVFAKLGAPIMNYAVPRDAQAVGGEYQPVFIIGSPRTGSTVLYQMLTYSVDCLYINNLVSIFAKSLPFGFSLSSKFYNNEPHHSFTSSFGNTNSWNSPSECPAFWFRWFPRSHDYVEELDISPEAANEIRTNIFTITEKYSKGIIFKNLTSGQRLKVLKSVFPNAKYIYLRRDPFYSAQSVLKARKKIGFDPSYWWSVKPKSYQRFKSMPLVQRTVNQIHEHEKQILSDLKQIPKPHKIKTDLMI